jgi:hypothetical protein
MNSFIKTRRSTNKRSSKMSGKTVLLFEKVSKTEFRHSIFEEQRMRKAYSKQRRLDSVPIDLVPLNLDCRDSIIPVLRALQHVYSDWSLTKKVLDLIGQDV